jgi:hypothetical protein
MGNLQSKYYKQAWKKDRVGGSNEIILSIEIGPSESLECTKPW